MRGPTNPVPVSRNPAEPQPPALPTISFMYSPAHKVISQIVTVASYLSQFVTQKTRKETTAFGLTLYDIYVYGKSSKRDIV